MKNHRLKSALIGLLLIVAPLVWTDEEYRTFKDSEGRTLKARVLEYNANTEKVKLKIEGSRSGWVPLTSLSEEDQTYVSEWCEQARFLSDELFEIDITEEDSGWERGIGPLVDERHSRFVIGLSNHGNADLSNIRIACCEIRDKDGATTYSHYNLETTKVRAGDKAEEEKAMFSRRNKKRETINSVIGVRLRLYWTSPDGRELIREISAPKDLSTDEYPWKDPEPEGPIERKTESLPITASINDVSTKEKEHTTKKRGTYKAQTFEYNYTISPCKSYRIKSYFEFKDHRDKVTFMSSQSNHSKGPSKQATMSSVLNIDAKEHGLKNIELNAYWIEIYAIDESGDSHLVAEAHDGCTSLEQLKERNDPPIGV